FLVALGGGALALIGRYSSHETRYHPAVALAATMRPPQRALASCRCCLPWTATRRPSSSRRIQPPGVAMTKPGAGRGALSAGPSRLWLSVGSRSGPDRREKASKVPRVQRRFGWLQARTGQLGPLLPSCAVVMTNVSASAEMRQGRAGSTTLRGLAV